MKHETKATLEIYLQNSIENLKLRESQRDALKKFLDENPKMGEYGTTITLCYHHAMMSVENSLKVVNNYEKLILEYN